MAETSDVRQTAASLRERAARYRRLAEIVFDAQTQTAPKKLAAEYEAKARELDGRGR
jgi:hypothetical protein